MNAIGACTDKVPLMYSIITDFGTDRVTIIEFSWILWILNGFDVK